VAYKDILNACMNSVLKPLWNRALVRTVVRCGYNIKVDLKGLGHENADWIRLAQDRIK